MSKRYHSFTEKLKQGNSAEDLIKGRLEKKLRTVTLSQIRFGDAPDKQRRGIDQALEKEEPTIDIKARDNYTHRFGDILLETVSDEERGTDGWFYKDMDLVVYVWWNQREDGFIDGYIIAMVDELREWFDENKEQFQVKRAKSHEDGRQWTTRNRAVPISEFPDGTLVNFDPSLPEPEHQTELGERWV